MQKENIIQRKTFSTELAYLLGIIMLAFGTALLSRADFGMSMVVAPAYILYLHFSQIWSFVTFGMMEYTIQALLLILLSIILKKFRIPYLFSFITAVLYGFTLDGFVLLTSALPVTVVWLRLLYFFCGFAACTLGVAFMFHTYLSPEAYELFVKELAREKHLNISKVKTIFDACFLIIAITLSFLFFGWLHFRGVNIGTVFCTLFNGLFIGIWGKWLERRFCFRDYLSLKRYFPQSTEPQ